jgi:hypothetical protein
MIKIRVERAVNADQVHIWIIETRINLPWAIYRPQTETWEQVDPGFLLNAIKPSLVISEEMFGALAAAVDPRITSIDLIDKHLRDATCIRDRLLTIIERTQGIDHYCHTSHMASKSPSRS